MKKKADLLTSRLRDYTRNNAVYRNSSGNRTVFLFTASAAAGLGSMICPPPAETAVQYSGMQNLAMGTQSPPKIHYLDLDGDGGNDFAFAFFRQNLSFTYYTSKAKIEYGSFMFGGFPGNNIIAEFNATSSSAARLPENYNIQQTLPGSPPTRQWKPAGMEFVAVKVQYSASWYSVTNSTFATSNTSDSSGNFVGKRGYLGISFQISGALHYGWIQFMTDEDMKNGRVIDWAYEDTPDTAIRAGEGRFNWSMFMPAIVQGGQNKP